MKRLGIVNNISHTGRLIIKGEFKPSVGCKVYTAGKKEVGTVVKVFGNVVRPYISVRPNKTKASTMLSLVEKALYVEE